MSKPQLKTLMLLSTILLLVCKENCTVAVVWPLTTNNDDECKPVQLLCMPGPDWADNILGAANQQEDTHI